MLFGRYEIGPVVAERLYVSNNDVNILHTTLKPTTHSLNQIHIAPSPAIDLPQPTTMKMIPPSQTTNLPHIKSVTYVLII